ncbi:MAG: AAA family ATPase [Anaerolineae bacterium]|nr:AAA family ATPase [Anaerolineae bacterium]
METTPEQLAQSARAYLVAAAGYGKTEIIARAVSLEQERRQLILTHTHAGVHSLKTRLKKLGVSGRYFRVNTIAGWALQYVNAYPQLSGIQAGYTPINNDEWRSCYRAAARLVGENRAIRSVVQASYAGVYVDEYQDCTISQHDLILQLAELIPCRVVGDPLQSLFDFSGEAIDWQEHVASNFQELPELRTPWRWEGANPRLGQWLIQLRFALLDGSGIDLRGQEDRGVYWRKYDGYQSILDACTQGFAQEHTVIVIREQANTCHKLAQNLAKWGYTSIEEMEAKDLTKWATALEANEGNQRAVAVIDFCSTCMTGVSTTLKSIKERFSNNSRSFSRMRNQPLISVLEAVADSDEFTPILSAISVISKLPEVRIYRRDLLREMKRALGNYPNGSSSTLAESARHTRNQTSVIGRSLDRRTISRTLLVKGLQFDHAVVSDIEKFNKHHLYVALTRGARSVTVVSTNPVITV